MINHQQNISKDFRLIEFLESQTARRKQIVEQFNPPAEVVENLRLLAINILQPLRDKVGPVRISSGYRCRRLNRAVGGAVTSQHLTGHAVDIQAIGGTNAELLKQIKFLKLPFDQLIHEYGTRQEPAWIHVSFSARHRRQELMIGVK